MAADPLGANARLGRFTNSTNLFDLAAVASGFVIRAIAGGLATGVPLSEWFLVVISAASLFVVAGKREPAGLDAAGAGPPAASRVAYPISFLRYIRLLTSGVALNPYRTVVPILPISVW